jgi:hypothetical protein
VALGVSLIKGILLTKCDDNVREVMTGPAIHTQQGKKPFIEYFSFLMNHAKLTLFHCLKMMFIIKKVNTFMGSKKDSALSD